MLMVVLFLAFLLAAVVIIIFMARQKDERSRAIVEKTVAKTFAVSALYLLFCVAKNIYMVVSETDLSYDRMNPFVTLTVIAVIYVVELVYYKKKYGD